MTADPGATPLTRPAPSTEAMLGSLVCHVTVLPVNGCPVPSSGVAVSCSDWLTTTVPFTGLMVIVTTCCSRAAISWHPARSTIPATNTFLNRASLRDNLCRSEEHTSELQSHHDL